MSYSRGHPRHQSGRIAGKISYVRVTIPDYEKTILSHMNKCLFEMNESKNFLYTFGRGHAEMLKECLRKGRHTAVSHAVGGLCDI